MQVKEQRQERMRLLTILAYLYFHPGNEGIGGQMAALHAGYWRCGTRLRAPWGPLYNMRHAERSRCFRVLHQNELIEPLESITADALQNAQRMLQLGQLQWRTTAKGLDLLKMFPLRLVHYITYYQFTNTGRIWGSDKYGYGLPKRFANMPGRGSSNSWVENVRIMEYEEATK